MLTGTTLGLAFAAGLLSTLSPCVLPLLPIVLTSATAAHRHAPLALAAGLAASYATVGSSLAWAGASLGVDTGAFRAGGAILLAFMGVVLMSATLQERFMMAGAGLGDVGHKLIGRVRADGLTGQFAVGALLAVVWSPCAGPTLGGAVALASQGEQLSQAAALMGVFGLGAAAPLLMFTYLFRQRAPRFPSRLLAAAKAAKTVMGLAMVLVAALILTGADKTTETWLVDHSAAWLTELTTRF